MSMEKGSVDDADTCKEDVAGGEEDVAA
jgi:hypothetical protein